MILIATLLTVHFVASPQSFAQAGTWTTKAPISSARYFSRAATLNGVLYTVGGWNGCTSYSNLEAYDPISDSWMPRASMLTSRGYHQVGVLNGLLYAVGGSVGCGAHIASVEAYDPTTNTWSAKASLPEIRTAHVVAVANGKLYAIGGINGGGLLASNTEYDPTTNTWTERAPMPTARYFPAVAVVNDIIYVMGGAGNSGEVATVEAYDAATNTWSTKAPLPLARSVLEAATTNGIIYTMGGQGSCSSFTDVETYDPTTDIWSFGTPMPTPRYAFGSAALNGTIYVVGGYTQYACGSNEGSVSGVIAFTPEGDDTAPSITITSPVEAATYLLGQSVTASYSCEDEAGGSGLASCTGSVATGAAVDTASVGPKTFTVNAEDNAGNQSTRQVSYQVVYSFAGFFQPVYNLPLLNITNAGSSIPVKFSLSGNQGLGIFAPGYPVSGPIACDANELGSEIDETVTAGGSALSYDAGADQYSYVWKTNKAWKGTCRILVVRFNDGTDHFAKFRFK